MEKLSTRLIQEYKTPLETDTTKIIQKTAWKFRTLNPATLLTYFHFKY